MSQNKVVIAGEANVGKTSLLRAFAKKENPTETEVTEAVQFVQISIPLEGDTIINAQFWDTAGQEKYRSLTPMYFSGAKIIILVYDITVAQSFSTLDSFVQILRQRAPPDVALIIVGNKADLSPSRVVTIDELDEYSKNLDAIFSIETSAKSNIGVEELLAKIGLILNEKPKNSPVQSSTTSLKPSTKSNCC